MLHNKIINIKDYITASYQSDLISWRRHLHKFPELSWQEFKTTEFIEMQLKLMGIVDIQQPFKTGLVATIKGDKDNGRCIALRADIDALPITEQNTCEYKSQNEGVMHACGHDVHTTCLLGAAKYLVEHKDQWQGTIKLIFQPSEEKQPSGAEAIIDAGILENPKVEHVIGLHVTPELEVGKLGFRKGQFMASADEIYMTVIGKGGHGASPHLCVDPIVLSANIILALQQIVSRYADPKMPLVLNFGDIQGHGATNIIPDKVEIQGTLRTFDEEWRGKIQEKIKDVAKGIAKSFGGDCEINIPLGLPYVKNDEALTDALIHYAEEFLGSDNIEEMPLRMGAEDFAYYSHQVPSSFFRLGTGNSDKATQHTVHNANFDIDENALIIGSTAMAEFGMRVLR